MRSTLLRQRTSAVEMRAHADSIIRTCDRELAKLDGETKPTKSHEIAVKASVKVEKMAKRYKKQQPKQ